MHELCVLCRLISAFYYRGHSPNLDFFQVRPEFKDIKEGRKPKVNFDEYIEMEEYQNIMTRMLGADSFPYRNVTINDDVFKQAIDAVNNFFFVGLQEAYEISVELLIRELNLNKDAFLSPIKKERDQSTGGKIVREKNELKQNNALLQRARVVNKYDVELYAMCKC